MEQTRDVTEGVNILSEKLGEYLDEEVVTNMTEIATAVNATKGAKFELVFDPTLVRGMSYYTGTIFEISMPELGAACGGGGRYDKMIGKFTGNDVPACGFNSVLRELSCFSWRVASRFLRVQRRWLIWLRRNIRQTNLLMS